MDDKSDTVHCNTDEVIAFLSKKKKKGGEDRDIY